MSSPIVYFIVGALLDILATLDVQAVARDKALRSASVSWLGTIIAYYIFYKIITGPDFFVGIIAYATGGFVGTIFIMRIKLINHYLIRGLEWLQTQLTNSSVNTDLEIEEVEPFIPVLHRKRLSSEIGVLKSNTKN